MNVTTSSISRADHNDRLTRQDTVPFDRFFSLNENALSSVENRRLSTHEPIGNFSADDRDSLSETFTYTCHRCSKTFASEYGLNHHMNMYHPNQSILCADCHLIFRSHRALKNHQQRFHLTYSQNRSNYNYLSSCLFVGFSTRQFSLIAKNACEQGRLPLGHLTSKLFPCPICHLSFPCSQALACHSLNQHEHYEYQTCKGLLHDLIVQVEENLRTIDLNDDDVEAMRLALAKQASQFGLVDKQLAREIRRLEHEQQQLIFPPCPHFNRTCANLCLHHLSSYHKLIENYPYQISTGPKGSPFAQGSIVAKPMPTSSMNIALAAKDGSLANPKRTPLKRFQTSISERAPLPQSKRRITEQTVRTNEAKLPSSEHISSSPKKTLLKIHHSYTRSSSSLSSSSSTSTRTPSMIFRAHVSGSLKRRTSPIMALAVERSSKRRRRQRERKRAKASFSSSETILKMDGDTEQENGDGADDVVAITYDKPKRQREASNSSVEYVQILHNEPQTVSSLNNIENFKLKPKNDEKDIIICDSPPTLKKTATASPSKHLSKTPVNGHQAPDYDEHVRVRCKVCGDILEGRSRFSKHVLTMHSHLVKNNNMSNMKQQQTTVVR